MFEKKEVIKRILTFAVLLFFSLATNAQTSGGFNFTNSASIRDSLLLTECLVLPDTNMQIRPEEAVKKNWRPLSSFNLKAYPPLNWVTGRIYLLLPVENTDSTSKDMVFFPGISFRSIQTYVANANGTVTKIDDLTQNDGYHPFTLKAHEKQVLLFQLRFTKYAYNYLTPQLIEADYLKKYQKIQNHKNEAHLITGYMISGILLMMCFFSLANYLLSYKSEFLLNGCYAFCMFLLFFTSTYFAKKSGIAASFFTSYGSFFLLVAGSVSYIAFTRKFLDTAVNFPRLNKLFKAEEMLFIVVLAIFTYLNFFTESLKLQFFIENFMKVTALLVGIAYIITSVVQKNRLLNYLAAGNVMLIAFSIISFYLLIFPFPNKGLFSYAILYYELGVVSEIIFFMLGLTYKNRIEIIDKIKEQEAFKRDAERQSFETKLAILNAQQQERNRISADMHDDLGAGITAIRLYSELAKANLTDAGSVMEIERISSSANELLNNMNAIIWTMSSDNDSLADMVSYIRSYGQEYFENTPIQCKFFIPDELPELIVSGQIRRNVFLVIKEALNNVLKHSKATVVSLTLITEPANISLLIQDNGIGIDLENVRRFGNGLKNMKRRMTEMGIDFSIENSNGTLIIMHYSLVTE